MSTKQEKKTKSKQAGPCTAPKLVNHAGARLRITKSQVTTPKKGEVGMSSSGSKVSTGILRGQQPTNNTRYKAALLTVYDKIVECGLWGETKVMVD